MKVFSSIDEMRRWRNQLSREETIGFVPTMGYLHRGHLSLFERATKDNDLLVISIFVNPVQFNDEDDYRLYPRDEQRDLHLADEAGVDVVFCPIEEDLYPKNYSTYVEVEELTEGLCGGARPGHFRGVTTIVAKLFNIVRPHHAYFGQKDYQQLKVIQRMVRDLHMDVRVIGCPTVREEDGLALSSRNKHLTSEERRAALVLPAALRHGVELIENGTCNTQQIKKAVRDIIDSESAVRLDYLELRDAEDLSDVSCISGDVVLAAAVCVADTRLIDNRVVQV